MIFFLFSFLACDTIESQLQTPEERLIELRFEQKEALDALYTEYGGGVLADNINKNADSVEATDDNAKSFLSALKNTVTSTDRASFDANCLEMGQGKTVPLFSDKAKTFFAKPETLATCKASALRALEIQKLELEIKVPTPQ